MSTTCRAVWITPQVGWLDLPGGRFSPDASSSAALAHHGYVAWDSGITAWLPTQPQDISPDGATYVPNRGSAADIQIADARTGAVLRDIPAGDYSYILAYTATGIYAESSGGYYSVAGLWNIDPSTGTVTQLQSSSVRVQWAIVDNHVAWGISGAGTDMPTVERLDLSTGAMTEVYRESVALNLVVSGFVGSRVLVLRRDGKGLLSAFVLGQDGSTVPVAVPQTLYHADVGEGYGILQDGPAILFSGLGYGLAAYDPGHGLQVLTDAPQGMWLLGRCIAQ